MNREGEGLAEPSYTQRLEADKRAKETLTAFRRHRFRPRPLARVEEHSLYDQHEGLLFREIRPGVYIAECSVTRNQYQRFVAETGFPANRYVQSTASSGNLPVTGVSWYEAMAYCGWFGGTLPSEREWEMAAGTMRGFKYADRYRGDQADLGGLRRLVRLWKSSSAKEFPAQSWRIFWIVRQYVGLVSNPFAGLPSNTWRLLDR